MGYILKNTSGLVNTRLTDAGRLKLSQGRFNIAYFQIGDSEVSYNSLPTSTYNQYNSFILEPSFNAQNIVGVPQSNKENIKYPYYVDGTTGNTYGIPFMDSIISPVFNTASPRGFFINNTGTPTNWSAITTNCYAINPNYVVQMKTLVGTNVITVTSAVTNNTPVRNYQVGDIITIIYDGEGQCNSSCFTATTTTTTIPPTTTTTTTNPCDPPIIPTTTTTTTCSPIFCGSCIPNEGETCYVELNSCYPILTYKITGVCLNQISLDRNTPDYSYLGDNCYARAIIYPSGMTEIYDSVTPQPHYLYDVINFESVDYTDQFNVKIWNMNIPWSENPAGLNTSTYKDYTQFGSINYLGSKEYFGYASSSGQTDTSFTYYYDSFDNVVRLTPEDQKAIAIVHYTNQTIDLYYGEKFALEPFDETTDDTTGQARNFKVTLPWLMWHKNPNCCIGQTFWVDPPGYENLNLFDNGVKYIKSTKNPDMNDPGIRYYHLYDNNSNTNGFPNRVGKVFPDSKIIIFDDEEIVAAMSYKSNRNWTLPAPQISLITPNTCGFDNSSTIGILTGNTEYLYVTYRFTNDQIFTNSLHCNYYQKITGPNTDCAPNTSQNVALRFGGEFGCLSIPTAYINQECPCWYSGLTLFFSAETNVILSYYLRPTGLYVNGYPSFYTNIDDITRPNFLFNGTNWIFGYSGFAETIINFNTETPIGNWTGGETSGYTTCEHYPEIVVRYCSASTNCDLAIYYYSIFNGIPRYWEANGDSGYIVYSGSNWNLEVGNEDYGNLTGLTINDLPIGNWNIDNPSLTAITTFEFSDYFVDGCSCYNVTAATEFQYTNCYDITLTSVTTNNLCVRTLTTIDFGTYPLIFNFNDILDCVSVCTTTTTINPCITTCLQTQGYHAERFEIICQKVIGNEKPNSSEWKIIDFTDQISGYTFGGFIPQSAMTATTFVITQDLYDSAPFYDLSDFIDLTVTGTTSPQLNFGDEYYFYGNIETDIQATIYEMRYKINLSQVEFQTSSNPTWNTSLKPYITEIGLFDSDKDLLIVSKMQSPILRQGIQQLLVKFDI